MISPPDSKTTKISHKQLSFLNYTKLLSFLWEKSSTLLIHLEKTHNIKWWMYWPQKVRQLIYPKDLVLYCTELSPFSFTLIRLLL